MLVGLPKFDHVSCETLEEACSLLSGYAGISRVLAGGTDLFVKMKHRRVIPQYLINIKKIPGLDDIRYDNQLGLRIGALTSIQEIKDSTLIREHFPILGEAAGKLGTTHIRNLGTLGGNLANASPAAEFAPPLLTLGARVNVVGSGGERTLSLEDFFIEPGKAAIRFDEILTEIRIPNQRLDVGIYLKYGTRPMDVAIVNLALTLAMDGEICEEIKIALGAVGPIPFRARRAEDVIRGTRLSGDLEPRFRVAAQIAVEESNPITDFRATAACRTGLIEALIMEALERAVRGTKSTRKVKNEA